jgi:CDGSH-type Zn-finger protein
MEDVEITIMNHGPIRVAGKDIDLKDPNGKPFDLSAREAISLCRCGHSKNKPFCDGSHKAANFHSEVQARALPPKT